MSMFVRVSHSETTHIMINNTQQCITRPLYPGPASQTTAPRRHPITSLGFTQKQDDEAKANAWLDANGNADGCPLPSQVLAS